MNSVLNYEQRANQQPTVASYGCVFAAHYGDRIVVAFRQPGSSAPNERFTIFKPENLEEKKS